MDGYDKYDIEDQFERDGIKRQMNKEKWLYLIIGALIEGCVYAIKQANRPYLYALLVFFKN